MKYVLALVIAAILCSGAFAQYRYTPTNQQGTARLGPFRLQTPSWGYHPSMRGYYPHYVSNSSSRNVPSPRQAYRPATRGRASVGPFCLQTPSWGYHPSMRGYYPHYVPGPGNRDSVNSAKRRSCCPSCPDCPPGCPCGCQGKSALRKEVSSRQVRQPWQGATFCTWASFETAATDVGYHSANGLVRSRTRLGSTGYAGPTAVVAEARRLGIPCTAHVAGTFDRAAVNASLRAGVPVPVGVAGGRHYVTLYSWTECHDPDHGRRAFRASEWDGSAIIITPPSRASYSRTTSYLPSFSAPVSRPALAAPTVCTT